MLVSGKGRLAVAADPPGKQGVEIVVDGARRHQAYEGFGATTLSAGAVVPNFTNGYTGSAPDIGAHESGTPPMQFWIKAYLRARPAPEAAK